MGMVDPSYEPRVNTVFLITSAITTRTCLAIVSPKDAIQPKLVGKGQ